MLQRQELLESDPISLPKHSGQIGFKVLGSPGNDNALFVHSSTGKNNQRFLFDCGANCLIGLRTSEIQAIDYLCLSHLHMDHIAGFDDFFRLNYHRPTPIRIFGPEKTSEIIHHRLQGYMWNCVEGQAGEVQVSNIGKEFMTTYSYYLKDGYKQEFFVNQTRHDNQITDDDTSVLQIQILDHATPSIAYILRMKDTINVDPEKLEKNNLEPGSWIQTVKDPNASPESTLFVQGKVYTIGELRAAIIETRKGESIAYLTDFRINESDRMRIIKAIEGCDTVICESNYREAEKALAEQNYHSTATEVASLAKLANPNQLVLIHFSNRYSSVDHALLLKEARAVFPRTYFPVEWQE